MKVSAGYDADGIKLSRRIPTKEETTSGGRRCRAKRSQRIKEGAKFGRQSAENRYEGDRIARCGM